MKNFAREQTRENLKTYDFYFNDLKRKIINLFKWENLPDGISQRFLETSLFDTGNVVFFKNEMGFYCVAKGTPMGLNEYDEPTGFNVYSTSNKIHGIVNRSECVPIYNDLFMKSSVSNVDFFAKRLGNIQKTIDVNLEHLKIPYVISCSEGQKATVEQMIAKKNNGEPYILTSDDITNLMKINVIDLNIKNYVNDLYDVRQKEKNESLTFFGINNVNIMKKERLTSNEGNQNNEEISINLQNMLDARQTAVEEINSKFNLDIKVSLKYQSQIHGGDNIE